MLLSVCTGDDILHKGAVNFIFVEDIRQSTWTAVLGIFHLCQGGGCKQKLKEACGEWEYGDAVIFPHSGAGLSGLGLWLLWFTSGVCSVIRHSKSGRIDVILYSAEVLLFV